MTPAPAKLHQLDRVILSKKFWNEDAEKWMRVIPHDSPGDLIETLKSRCENGNCDAVEILNQADKKPVGFMVYEIQEIENCRPEFVVHAAAGRDGSDLTEALAGSIISYAKEKDCGTVRFHTMRAGLIAKSAKLGFHVSEVILRKQI